MTGRRNRRPGPRAHNDGALVRSGMAAAGRQLKASGRGLALRFRRARAWARARPRLMARVGFGALAGTALFGGLAIGSWTAVCRDCPSIARIYVWEPKSATQILDRDGKLIAQLFQERRTPIDINTLPPYVPQAFVAIEDKRFYRHNGFDLVSLVGSNVRNVVRGRRLAGASTITQQLARWMFSDEIGFERYLTRKMKELKVALELERVYSKDLILEAYINQVNYGDGHYGIEAASQYFFGKPAIELQPVDAALLAAVINLPQVYSPFRHPERALQRRNTVLGLMAEQGYLSEDVAEQLMTEPLPDRAHRTEDGPLAPYFVEMVRDELDDRYGEELYLKGFRVTTSLDIEMQRHARTAMDTQWARIERTPGFSHPRYAEVKEAGGTQNATETQYLQGMFIAVDPASGEIRALIGGRDFEDSKFNRAVQALRQPGSTFKPFVYTAAIASGMPISNVIFDSPIMLEMPDSTIYSPKNYDPEFRGPLTLRDALKHSVNTVAVKLGLEVGLETVAQTARRMGIQTPVGAYPSTS
ncbi:MAG: transglycosylase domain-containing protein, partial [Gemmatimonadetes bacterium]|nr:transglycosylase domain-containing protein [Gemmatimonadota bacterium]